MKTKNGLNFDGKNLKVCPEYLSVVFIIQKVWHYPFGYSDPSWGLQSSLTESQLCFYYHPLPPRAIVLMGSTSRTYFLRVWWANPNSLPGTGSGLGVGLSFGPWNLQRCLLEASGNIFLTLLNKLPEVNLSAIWGTGQCRSVATNLNTKRADVQPRTSAWGWSQYQMEEARAQGFTGQDVEATGLREAWDLLYAYGYLKLPSRCGSVGECWPMNHEVTSSIPF